MKFKRKPIVVEAFRWTIDEVPKWWEAAGSMSINVANGSVFIPTPEGIHEAQVGDWIIRDIQGEIYPIKDDTFWKTYEKIID